ncbi:hypothetical protein BKA83DRAFT_4005707, partial [Pisolithus microcarpus]
LDVDSSIWQDVGLGEGNPDPPQWLADEDVCKGIRLMLEVDCCNEEEGRLSREWSILQEWFAVEWCHVQVALANADEHYIYHLQAHKSRLVAVYVRWEAMVQHIPYAWAPSRAWGPTPEDIAYCLSATYNSSTVPAADQPTEGVSQNCSSDDED